MNLLLFTITLAIVAALSSFLDIEKKSKNYKIKNILIGIFLVGTIISSIFQFRASEKDKRESEKKDSAFVKSQKDLIELQIKNKKESDSLDNVIISLNNKLDNKTEDLLEVSDKALKSQSEYIKYTNGSDLPELGFVFRSNNLFSIFFKNSSDYPIYNAKAVVKDFDLILERCPHQIKGNKFIFFKVCYDPYISDYNIGTISPYKESLIDHKYFFGDTHHYVAEFKTTRKTYIFYFIVNYRTIYFNTVYRVYELSNSGKQSFIKEYYATTTLDDNHLTNKPYPTKEFKVGPKFSDKYWEDKFHMSLTHEITNW
ncbi:hypothetical protein SAMN05421856_105242 [Chryseobacterium taichungense]|uniref:Uncharacterized protein n=1 Tax=Chryseobacterium taichungense TaxID=295069 RepID=A0A1H8ABR3_9FLAO|nr:hypothetical protein [Chryseobacterium taichungense]SEM67993.1 hypothetical protein SAMN05421856_105242 [Chryseobacterium taichungense]